MSKTVIVRYGELALKSEPVRWRFERHLISSINLTLKGLNYKIRRERGRIFVDTSFPNRVIKRLSKVPGVVSVSPAIKTDANVGEIRKAALRAAKVLGPGMGFAVRTSRVGEHKFSSMDVNVDVGAAVLSKVKGVHVDLSSPDREIFVEVRGGDAYVFTKTVEGVGGLPMGTQGRVVALFSGNRDDTVAAYLLMKRGSTVFPVFPNPRSRSASGSQRLVVASANKLADLDPNIRLHVIQFGKLLSKLKKVRMDGYAYCIWKRSALRAADVIAERVGAEAVMVADDIDQIAAQRLANLNVIDEVCKRPVLRPLDCFDRDGIGLIKVKIKPPSRSKEACPFPLPRDVVDLGRLRGLEDEMKIGALVDESLSNVKVSKLR